MVRRIIFYSLLVLLSFLAVACTASAQAATATPRPGAQLPDAAATLFPPDTTLATPEAGFARVIQLADAKAIVLRSQPDQKSDIAGVITPGASGLLLGRDASGFWVLVEIDQQTGWLPIELVNLTIEN